MMNRIITDGAELKLASGLREIDDRYPYLNHGGCLYVAKWIGEAFLAKGLQVEYLIADGIPKGCEYLIDDFKVYANTESLEALSDRMIEVSHILPIINNRLFVDSKGVNTSFEGTRWSYLTNMGNITHKTLLRWVDDRTYNWNPKFRFNHKHQLYVIENDIKSLIKSLRI
jgi:hypothetical protein